MEKKHLVIIIFLLLISFGLYIYFYPCKKALVTSTNTVCMDYSTYAPSELSATLVKNMITNYKTNQLQSITTSTTHPMADDAHSIWFDIDTLKKFIYHTEMAVKQNDPSVAHKLGLRIYYAAYPDQNIWGSRGLEALNDFNGDAEKRQYGKMHTLVMVPTILNGTTYCDFNPKDKNSYVGYNALWAKENGNPPPSYKSIVLTARASASASEDIGARNHGQLIPPADATGEGF